MSETFVDLSYRGLALGRRVKLSDVRPTTGYVEMPTPMPVGTQIAITTDDAVALDATVVEIREQVAGSEKPPGMLLKPRLDAETAKKWWEGRVSLPEDVKPAVAAEPAKAVEPVVVVSKRMTNPGMGVPDVDDGHDTGVMEAIDPTAAAEPTAISAPITPPVEVREDPALENTAMEATAVAPMPVEDDGKKTTAMDAVDLEALGLVPPSRDSGPIAKATDDDDDKSTANETPAGDKSDGKSVKRRRKKR